MGKASARAKTKSEGAKETRSQRADIDQMRRAYEALSRGDVETVLGIIDPEVEISDRPEIPDPQTYRGHEGARAALQQSFDTFEELQFEPEQFFQVGDRIVVVIRMRGKGRESGVPVEDHIAHLWTLRDGRAWRLQVYSDPDQAIADAQGSVG
jgi:ketosteroid isomerase-like protein